MAMKKFEVQVTQIIEVKVDEAKFTDEFMGEFASTITPFATVEEHAEHLGWLHATGRYDLEVGNDFIEGYGPRKDTGISASVISTETEVSNA